jgi:hypothetical protein
MGCDLPGCECASRCLRAYCPPDSLEHFDTLVSIRAEGAAPRLRAEAISVAEARQAERLGVLDAVLLTARLNERCDQCGNVPRSIECRAAHDERQPEVAALAPRQPWEARPSRYATAA